MFGDRGRGGVDDVQGLEDLLLHHVDRLADPLFERPRDFIVVIEDHGGRVVPIAGRPYRQEVVGKAIGGGVDGTPTVGEFDSHTHHQNLSFLALSETQFFAALMSSDGFQLSMAFETELSNVLWIQSPPILPSFPPM